ncbi:MAG: ABC-2 transporter permease [Eubacteriaceae bacterium]|nr:ABC-2 transporter permease [Eubacteriaceae bacterium]
MKGLLLKDLVNLKQQTKIYIIIIAVWLAIALSSKDGSFLGGMICVLSVMLPITTLSYDEKAKWDKYVLSMPVSRKQVVESKYILALALSFIGCIISFAFNLFITKDASQSILMSLAFWAFSIFAFSVILPLIYKFGVEKGRAIILIVFLAPTVLAILIGKLNINLPSKEFLYNLKFVVPIFIIAALLLSCYISIKIFKNKEL